ncbi:hypothetical protein BJY01DRAFT_213775 [Aspergillus pseudoustus]|uniref:Zn(2)-C6 fungal-type domain-containing protein n=1 Tax=Aspergillus pseudoustus TaxID=1810923 RepID=A0ABR4K0V4_9EURO
MQTSASSKVKKRSRIPLSCEFCRARKLKCNREKPCQNCIVRGEQNSCAFRGVAHSGPSLSPNNINHVRTDPMRQRIEHLENIVKGLIAQRDSPPETTVSSFESSEPNPGYGGIPNCALAGTTVIDGAQSVFKATDDWHDVLNEVNELKRLWDEFQEEPENESYQLSNTVDGTSLLFSQVQPVDIAEIIASLPPKPEIDKLLQWFFDYDSFPLSIPPILHQPTFMREYNGHWKDPSQTSMIWIGLLFSILGITMLASQFDESPEYQGISESRFELYRLRTAQSLLMGDLAKCLPYTVETLRFNATAELNRKDDNSRGLWIMAGVIVRVAVNMGYHRDPSHTPGLSALQTEYRRRLWLSVTNMDEVASFLSGFPRMVPSIHADSKEPRNLHEWELTDDTTTLPISRPLSETTPATYLIAKSRLFRGLGNIVDLHNSPKSRSYSSVLDVDKYLQKAYSNLPLQLRVDACTADRNSFTKQSDYSSLQLMLMYHHGLITLHRPHIPRNGDNPPGNISRSRCLNAALALLGYQRLLQPHWYTFSQTRKILARAAMILLLEFESRRKALSYDTEVPSDSLLNALDLSMVFWNQATDSCEEALQVHAILTKLFLDFREPRMLVPENNQPLDAQLFDLPIHDIDWASWDQYFEGEWP